MGASSAPMTKRQGEAATSRSRSPRRASAVAAMRFASPPGRAAAYFFRSAICCAMSASMRR